MTCPACGTENDEGVRFCGSCGTQQAGAVIPKAAVRSRARTLFQGSGSGVSDVVPPARPASSAPPTGGAGAGPAELDATLAAPATARPAAAVRSGPTPGPGPASGSWSESASPGARVAAAPLSGAAPGAAGAQPSGAARAAGAPLAGARVPISPRPAAAVAPRSRPPTTPLAELPPPPVDQDLAGRSLNGRYLVKERLGEGGFGAVYRGEQTQMSRACALKVLHARMARDQQVVGRFRREAKAASVLRDSHTVQIYDFDETPDGILYLAMELLTGRSLHEHIQEGPLETRRVLHILDGICSSLGEAHQNGIVHRDIKSENIYLEPRAGDPDFAKVLDFGIAKIVSGEGGLQGPALTAAGQTLGTVEYMSPEQLTGQQLDGRSDIYALGVLAYEMLTGGLPFLVRNSAEMITAHLKTVPAPPSGRAPDRGIPAAVDQIVLRCLEKRRDRRFRDTLELQTELRRVLALLDAGELNDKASAITSPGRHPASATTTRRRGPLPPGAVLVLAGIVVAVLGIVTALLLWSSRARADAPATPAVRLIPRDVSALLAIDVAQLRAAGPPSVVSQLVEAARPAMKRIGADPARLGQVALGVDVADVGTDKSLPAVLVIDLPVDREAFEKSLVARAPFATTTHQGQAIRTSGQTAYALLPGDRILLGENARVEALVDLAHGVESAGKPLVDDAAAGLLARVGAAGGRGPALFGWMRITDKARAEIDKQAPGAARLDEAAAALTTSPSGADLKVVGHATTRDGAQQAARSARAALVEAGKSSTVALLGLKALADAARVESSDRLVTLTLHLTPDQYGDVVTRLVGLAMAAQQAAEEGGATKGGGAAEAPVPASRKRGGKRAHAPRGH